MKDRVETSWPAPTDASRLQLEAKPHDQAFVEG